MYDVIVSGAGPAGSVAATVLARAGARVLMLDRATFPRDKLCGDTVNPGACEALRRLDLWRGLEARGLPLTGMIVSGARGVRVAGEYQAGARGLSILRRDLDDALLSRAIDAGARVEQGVLVRGPLLDTASRKLAVRGVVVVGRDGGDVRIPCPLVIAADGRRSRIGVSLGLVRHPRRPRRWAIASYFAGVQGLTTMGEMHIRGGGYLGIAPVPGGLANVCVVTDDRRRLQDPVSCLTTAIATDPALAPRFAGAERIGDPRVMGPLAVDAESCGTQGVLLAGDAAGFIDPMTGDGLRFAIIGGELAAHAALAALRDGRPAHRQLRDWRARAFARKWRFNRSLRRLVASPALVSAASVIASMSPRSLQAVIGFAGDVGRGGLPFMRESFASAPAK